MFNRLISPVYSDTFPLSSYYFDTNLTCISVYYQKILVAVGCYLRLQKTFNLYILSLILVTWLLHTQCTQILHRCSFCSSTAFLIIYFDLNLAFSSRPVLPYLQTSRHRAIQAELQSCLKSQPELDLPVRSAINPLEVHRGAVALLDFREIHQIKEKEESFFSVSSPQKDLIGAYFGFYSDRTLSIWAFAES